MLEQAARRRGDEGGTAGGAKEEGMMPGADQKHVLAIDLGTGGPKVGLVSSGGQVVASAFERNELVLLPDGGAEQDPNEWWQSVLRAAKKVLREARVAPESVVSVGCTGQWGVTVAVDENGQPLMNAISWLDTRGAPYNQAISRGFPSIEGYGVGKLIKWIQRAGSVPTHRGNDSVGHMLFIQHERPDIYRKTYKFLEPLDYINMRLTGRAAASQSTVFPLAMTDNRRWNCRTYDPWLVGVTGIDPAKLPELLPNDGIVGPLSAPVASELGLRPSTTVIVGAFDNHTSAIGSGAVKDYEAVAVLGTSGYLACHVPFKKTDLNSFITTMASPLRNRYLIFGDLGNNGNVLDAYLRNQVYFHSAFASQEVPNDVYDRMSRVAEEVPAGSDGVIFLPWFNGTMCPQEDGAMRGGFINLSRQTTRAHMTRAVLEGFSYNWRWLVGAAEKFVGRKFAYLHLAGGGALSGTWAQIMADVVGMPVHQQADPRNGNVLGISLLALNRVGLLAVDDFANRVRVAHVFEPRKENRDVYDRLFREFMACQRGLKPIFHALNGS
jgi:xylulokinase